METHRPVTAGPAEFPRSGKACVHRATARGSWHASIELKTPLVVVGIITSSHLFGIAGAFRIENRIGCSIDGQRQIMAGYRAGIVLGCKLFPFIGEILRQSQARIKGWHDHNFVQSVSAKADRPHAF